MNAASQRMRVWAKLPYRIVAESPWVYALCDPLKLNGSGDSEVSAVSELRNAIQGLLQISFEDGTIHELLREAGFGFHQVDKVAQWASEDPREPGEHYKNLEFEFAFDLERMPDVPIRIEPLPDAIRSLVMAIRGSDQCSLAA